MWYRYKYFNILEKFNVKRSDPEIKGKNHEFKNQKNKYKKKRDYAKVGPPFHKEKKIQKWKKNK